MRKETWIDDNGCCADCGSLIEDFKPTSSIKSNLIKYFLRFYILKNILHTEIYDETQVKKLEIALNNVFNDVNLIKYKITDSQVSISLSFKDEDEIKVFDIVIKPNAQLEKKIMLKN